MPQSLIDPAGHVRPYRGGDIPFPSIAYPSRFRLVCSLVTLAEVVLYAAVWWAMGTWTFAFLVIPFVGIVTVPVLCYQWLRNQSAPMASWFARASDQSRQMLADGDRLHAERLALGAADAADPARWERLLRVERDLRARQESHLFDVTYVDDAYDANNQPPEVSHG